MTANSGVDEYARRVGERLRDRPDDERVATVKDLSGRFAESGLDTYGECVEHHGDPGAYGDELRESLGYRPLRRRRMVPIAIGILAALVVGGVVFLRRDTAPNPETFAPIKIGSSSAAGSSLSRVADVVLLTVGKTPGTARLDILLTNSSSFDLHVESLGSAEFTWGKDYGLGSNQPGPGRVTFNDIWNPTVMLGDYDPTNVVFGEPTSPRYKPFQAFTWKPHQTIYLVMTGDVPACPSALTDLIRGSGPIAQIKFTAAGSSFTMSPFPSQLILEDCFPKP